jgi:hypothetical protein
VNSGGKSSSSMSFVKLFISAMLRFVLLEINDMNSRTNVLNGQEGDVVEKGSVFLGDY